MGGFADWRLLYGTISLCSFAMGRWGMARKAPHLCEGVNFWWLQQGKLSHAVSLSVRDTHHPVLRGRFKLQPLLFEDKVLDPELALPTAFQAALFPYSWCEAGRSRLQKLTVWAAMHRQSLCMMRPRSSQVLWKVMAFLLMAVSRAFLATVEVNSWKKMQKYR